MNLRSDTGPAERWTTSRSGLLLPNSYVFRPVAVDLFAGCGGFSLGMHMGGFHVGAALEMDFAAVTTYAVNLARPGVRFHFDTPERQGAFEEHLKRHMGFQGRGSKAELVQPMLAGSGWISGEPESEPGCEHIWVADARAVKGAEILSALGLELGEVDCVFGGPPCQGFSNSGRRDVMDPRNSLVFEFVRLVLEIRPRTMVMENVPGMLSMVTPEGIPVVDAICLTLERGGFGTYDALRRALAGRDGTRAVIRDSRQPKRARKEAATLPLFDEPVVS